MIRSLAVSLSLFCSLPAFVRTARAAEPESSPQSAVVVVESPPKDSPVKEFNFAGGTPAQFIAELKKVYGGFGSAVTMADETGGDPLPAARVFSTHAHGAAQSAAGKRLATMYNDNWLRLRFLPAPKPSEPTATSTGSPNSAASATIKPAAPSPGLFQFPGGSPAELVAALDQAYRTSLSEVLTVAPEMTTLKIPPLRMKAGDPLQVFEMLNDYSGYCAGAVGLWTCQSRDGEDVHEAAETDILLVTPLYSDDNPSPASAARDAAPAAAAMKALRDLGRNLQTIENSTSQSAQTLQQIQERLSKVEAKLP